LRQPLRTIGRNAALAGALKKSRLMTVSHHQVLARGP
jgi:hypothetical protein